MQRLCKKLLEELNLDVSTVPLALLRAYPESRFRVPVFRYLYSIELEKLPAKIFCGEGERIEYLGVQDVDRNIDITPISAEDIRIYREFRSLRSCTSDDWT